MLHSLSVEVYVKPGDSTVLLHHASKQLAKSPVFTLSYDYGQRYKRELACSEWQAQALEIADERVIAVSLSKIGMKAPKVFFSRKVPWAGLGARRASFTS
ncbi:MAG: hypothetical protein AMXMBFR84_13430 [Candidatus Hydrogenedentota bacterium]